MARTSINVIKFNKYNQAIYPFDYYVEVESTDTGKLTVVENNASTNQINWNDITLINSNGEALYSEYIADKYVLKVLGFFKQSDATSKEFEYVMNEASEKYILVAKNTVAVPKYYVECLLTDTGAITVKSSGATGEDQINYNDATLIGANGSALYGSAPSGKYVILVSGNKTLTIKKGDGPQSVNDMVYTLKYGGTYYIVLESGKCKKLYGEDKGKVIIVAEDSYVELAALRLE